MSAPSYWVSVDVAELPDGARMREQFGPTLPTHVRLDDDGRLRRRQLDMTVKAPASASAQPDNGASSEQVKATMAMSYSDFGTEGNTEAPPADQEADRRTRP